MSGLFKRSVQKVCSKKKRHCSFADIIVDSPSQGRQTSKKFHVQQPHIIPPLEQLHHLQPYCPSQCLDLPLRRTYKPNLESNRQFPPFARHVFTTEWHRHQFPSDTTTSGTTTATIARTRAPDFVVPTPTIRSVQIPRLYPQYSGWDPGKEWR